MAQSQIHKARKALSKLEGLYRKTERRLDNLKRNLADQKQFLELAKSKMAELEVKNAVPATEG